MWRSIAILMLLTLSVGCVQQRTQVQPEQPVVTVPIIVAPPDQPIVDAGAVEIDRDTYAAIVVGDSIDAARARIGIAPVLRIPQPDGGVLLRYKLLDSDGEWRSRHANFLFDRSGKLTRKSIS